MIFGCYDADKDEQFVRYPAVIRLDNYRLIIQLPTKGKIDDKKDIKFIGYREYLIKGRFQIEKKENIFQRLFVIVFFSYFRKQFNACPRNNLDASQILAQ